MKPLLGLRSHCPACAAELSLHERHSGGFCLDWQCRWRRVEAQRRADFEQRMLAERDAAALRAKLPEARLAPMVVVRLYQTGLEAVPTAQREAMRSHLMALQPQVEALRAAAETRAATPAPDTAQGDCEKQEIDALLGQVCASCTGHCCRPGFGGHGFLDAAALFKLMQASPRLSHVELVESYIGAIPELHHAQSCAFHGEQGCALPRQRRADICNDFECPGLEATRQHAESSGVRRVWVVRRESFERAEVGFVPPLPAAGNSGV